MSRPSDHPPPPQRRTVGAIVLISLGLLLLVPSGLCTGVMGLIDIIGNHGGDMVILALVYGGLPITLGFVLLVLGLNLPRQQ
ncbi:MAG TPA: hypothetical protein VGU20_16420 [Stellaceae bacterium]|nr:hypothetical protein [Stellaceae bacterium]